MKNAEKPLTKRNILKSFSFRAIEFSSGIISFKKRRKNSFIPTSVVNSMKFHKLKIAKVSYLTNIVKKDRVLHGSNFYKYFFILHVSV